MSINNFKDRLMSELESMSDQELARQIEDYGRIAESFLEDLKRYRQMNKMLLGERSRRQGRSLMAAACICGKTYQPSRSDQKFCSATCRQRNYAASPKFRTTRADYRMQTKQLFMDAVLRQDREASAALKEQGMRGLMDVAK